MNAHDRAVVDEFLRALTVGAAASDVKALTWQVFQRTSCGLDLEELATNRLAVVTAALVADMEDGLPVLAAAASGEPCPQERLDDLSELYNDWLQARRELADVRRLGTS